MRGWFFKNQINGKARSPKMPTVLLLKRNPKQSFECRAHPAIIIATNTAESGREPIAAVAVSNRGITFLALVGDRSGTPNDIRIRAKANKPAIDHELGLLDENTNKPSGIEQTARISGVFCRMD